LLHAITEAERLLAYLPPLSQQLKENVHGLEKALAGTGGREGGMAGRAARVVGGMLGREGWRKQGLIEEVQTKLARVLQLEEVEEEEEGGEEGREGGVEGVLAAWGLVGRESSVDVVLGE